MNKTILGVNLKTLFGNYLEYLEISKNPETNILDLSDIQFITPTVLLPCLHFAREHSMKIGVNDNTSDYVKRVLGIVSGPDTTLPFRRIPQDRSKNNELINDIVGMLDLTSYGGELALNYLLTEMINNVIDHSEYSNAYTYVQRYPRLGSMDISFYDDGISIPSSYENCGYDFNDDCDAINKAINGVSTKEGIDDEPRGFGINTSAQLVIRGNKGSILIASRGGVCFINQNGKRYKALKGQNVMQGTLVSIRVRKTKVKNFYNYMDYKRI